MADRPQSIIRISNRTPFRWWPLIGGIDGVAVSALDGGDATFNIYHPMTRSSHEVRLASGQYRVDVECLWSRDGRFIIDVGDAAPIVVTVLLPMLPLGRAKVTVESI
jgi:hypothetical protein